MKSQFTPRTKVNIPLDGTGLSDQDQAVLQESIQCYQLPNYKLKPREVNHLTGKDIYYISHHGMQVPDQIVLENGIYSTYRIGAPKSWAEQSDPNLAVVALKLMRWDDHPWPPEKVYVRRKKEELDLEVAL